MVRTLNVTLDDGDFERVEAVKDDLGYTWQEFILEATEALEESGEE